MDDLDPTTAASLADLAACLKLVHLRADTPTYRALEQQTAHASGFLPGTRLRRVRLTRSIVSDVLLGRKFPGKAFLLTFVDACGIDLENDDRWEQAWDRLAAQYQQAAPPGRVNKLRQENEELRQQLTAAEQHAGTAQPVPQQPSDVVYLSDPAVIRTMRLQSLNEARNLGELLREGTPVIADLTAVTDSDAKRLEDFLAGLIFGLQGTVERMVEKMFLLCPHNIEITAESKARIVEELLSQNRLPGANLGNNTGTKTGALPWHSGFHQPVGTAQDEVRIGIWGSPASGKTTFLAALGLATRTASPPGKWAVIPGNGVSEQLLIELIRPLVERQEFPQATVIGDEVELLWHFIGQLDNRDTGLRPRRQSQSRPVTSEFLLSMIDVSGEVLSGRLQAGHAATANAKVLDHLAASQGLLYLFDPIGEEDRHHSHSAEYMSDTIIKLHGRMLRENRLIGGYLPQQLSVCMTKFDHPDSSSKRASQGWSTADRTAFRAFSTRTPRRSST